MISQHNIITIIAMDKNLVEHTLTILFMKITIFLVIDVANILVRGGGEGRSENCIIIQAKLVEFPKFRIKKNNLAKITLQNF